MSGLGESLENKAFEKGKLVQLIELVVSGDLTVERASEKAGMTVEVMNNLVKLLVRAWDPDFTKVTEEERKRMDRTDKEMREGVYFSEDEVWN